MPKNYNHSKTEQYLDKNIGNISIEEFKSLIPDILYDFDKFIQRSLVLIYSNHNELNRLAYKNLVQDKFIKCFSTYTNNKYHLDPSRCFYAYLTSALYNLNSTEKNSYTGKEQHQIYICPVCKSINNRKEELKKEDNSLALWSCEYCRSEIQRLKSYKCLTKELEQELFIRLYFDNHSSSGYECTKCKKYVPKNKQHIGYCGFCGYWIDTKTKLKRKNHPIARIDKEINNEHSEYIKYESKTERNIDHSHISIHKSKIISEIDKQIRICTNRNLSYKKRMMYQAFKDVLVQDTVQMMSYLYGVKVLGEGAFQSKIWQRFVKIVEESGMFSDLLDSDIFLGKEYWSSYISKTGIVQNNTKTTFFGKKKKGSAYIGKLISITDDKGNDLMEYVDYYQMSRIRMKLSNLNHLKPLSAVNVESLSIPPHYETGAMLYLQRCRKHLVKFIKSKLK